MLEIEIGVLKQQCLGRRIAEREIALWQARRNQEAARIQWMFTTERAREELGCVYRLLMIIRQEAEKTNGKMNPLNSLRQGTTVSLLLRSELAP